MLKQRIQAVAVCGVAVIHLAMGVDHLPAQSPLPNAAPNMPPALAMPVAPASEFLKLRPQFISANELSLAVQLAISDQGTLAVLPGQEILLVAGPPEVLQRAIRMLEQVDTPRLQVRLAVHLFDVELNALKQLGLAAATQLKSQAEASGLSVDAANESLKAGESQFHVLARQLEFNDVLKMLQENAGAKLLADPLMTVVDRQTASFSNVTRIHVGSATQSDRSGQSQTSNIEEAGVKLAITPRLANDSSIELRIAPEYSSLIGFNSQGLPVLEVRRAETIVRVANRETLVIGGLRKRTTVESSPAASGMLGLKAVTPVFRNAATTEPGESELICLVRPEIVGLPTAAMQEMVQQPRLDRKSVVQSGAFQVTSTNSVGEQVTPSAYQPSVYNKPRTQVPPARNINTSRNSVTQPLPFSVRP